MSCVEATIAQFALALLQIVVRRRFTPRMYVKTSSDTVSWESEKSHGHTLATLHTFWKCCWYVPSTPTSFLSLDASDLLLSSP